MKVIAVWIRLDSRHRYFRHLGEEPILAYGSTSLDKGTVTSLCRFSAHVRSICWIEFERDICLNQRRSAQMEKVHLPVRLSRFWFSKPPIAIWVDSHSNAPVVTCNHVFLPFFFRKIDFCGPSAFVIREGKTSSSLVDFKLRVEFPSVAEADVFIFSLCVLRQFAFWDLFRQRFETKAFTCGLYNCAFYWYLRAIIFLITQKRSLYIQSWHWSHPTVFHLSSSRWPSAFSYASTKVSDLH